MEKPPFAEIGEASGNSADYRPRRVERQEEGKRDLIFEIIYLNI
jgi:hypothetical protein